MNQDKLRFYHEDDFSFFNIKTYWKEKREFKKELLEMFFVTLAEDENNTTKNNDDPIGEYECDSYFEAGEIVSFKTNSINDVEFYFTLFSNFKSVFKWYEPDIDTIVMPEFSLLDAFEMVEFDPDYSGIIINPGSTHWIITSDEIREYRKKTLNRHIIRTISRN